MIRYGVTLALLALGTVSLSAQPSASPPTAPVQVKMETSIGAVTLSLDVVHAPITAGNFLRYVEQKRLDGTSFYRGVGTPDYGFVQGGAQNDPRRVLPPVAHEPTSTTGLTHDDGALSMARYAPGSATSDFFIVLGRMPSMDAQPDASGDNQGFAVFGHVVEGMDVVRAILATPKSPIAGDGVMKGQMLAEPVRIVSVRRLN